MQIFILFIVIFSTTLSQSLGRLEYKVKSGAEAVAGVPKGYSKIIVQTELQSLEFDPSHTSPQSIHFKSTAIKTGYELLVNIEKLRKADGTFSSLKFDGIAKHYEPLPIELSVLPARAYTINLNPVRKLGNVIPVNIIVTPRADRLAIDGNDKTENNQTYQLALGKHTLRISKDGYREIEKEFNVTSSNNLFRFTLEEVDPQLVVIASEPENAQLFVDGKLKGQTPKQLFLYPKPYVIKLIKDGYLISEKTVEIKEKSENRFNLTLIKNSGYLNLNVTPANAQVMLNNKIQSTKGLELSPGVYQLEVFADGYDSDKKEVRVERGNTNHLDIRLEKKTGTLQLTINPADAILKINNEKTNERNIELSEGLYKIDVEAVGYVKKSQTVKLSRNQNQNLEIHLEARTGKLQFLVEPMNSDITLLHNGIIVREWKGSTLLKDLIIGNYEIKAQAEDFYQTEPLIVTVNENKTNTIHLTLSKEPPQQKIFTDKRDDEPLEFSAVSEKPQILKASLSAQDMKFGEVTVTGESRGEKSRSESEIQRVINIAMPAFEQCLKKQQRLNPSLSGTVRVKFTITKHGSISDVRIISDTVGDSRVQQCIKQRLSRLRGFGRAKADITVNNVVFTFN